MVEEIRFNTLEELRSTSESANSLLRSNILVVSAIIAGLSFLYSSNAGTVGDIAQNYGFIFGTGCLLGSIILSMQTQILRWSENSNIIPVNLYRQSNERAVDFSTEYLQKKVRKAQGILYISYALFFIGLTSLALPLALKIPSTLWERLLFLIPLVISFATLIYFNRKKK